MNPGIFFEEKIAAGLQANVSKAQEINAIYQFCLTGDEGGDWTLDLKVPEVRVGLDEGVEHFNRLKLLTSLIISASV